MTAKLEPLVTIATTDLSAISRGRPVPAGALEKSATSGVGWVPANVSLTPFGSIVADNPWGSSGDLRLVPDLDARFRTGLTGSETPFDVVFGDITELDGSPWIGCTRSLLKSAIADLKAETGLNLVATFEQEFQIFGAAFPEAHPFSIAALRRADPFPSQVFAALAEAGAAPEMVLAEYGANQFEVTTEPAGALAAADRAVAIREITREIARNKGWRASFAPKTSLQTSGNGVHIHFSFTDKTGKPATYDAARPGGLSDAAGAFCAGILDHLPAITCLTASSVPSYYRLQPHSWSSSYTWLAQQDREASLRICPVVTMGGRDPSKQFNIEYRVADATANPYLALAVIIRAGLAGLRAGKAAPPLFSGDPESLSAEERKKLGLFRLPQSLPEAVSAMQGDATVLSWLAPQVAHSFTGIKAAEAEHCATLEAEQICRLYSELY